MVKAQLLEQTEIKLLPTRHLFGSAVALAVEFNHPAYDCLYFSPALERGWRFVTADKHFKGKVLRIGQGDFQT